MTKHIDTEIMAILRAFGVAGERSSKKSILSIKEYSPRQLTRVISFVFERAKYVILYDTSAADDTVLALQHIRQDIVDVEGHFVRSPKDTEAKAYGMPYKGKDVYLLQQKTRKTRLDTELSQRYPHISRSTLQKYIKSGYVSVNGVAVTVPKADVSPLDTLALVTPPAIDHSESSLPILYIDDSVIVMNKPSGILSHTKGAMNDEFTVADFVRRYTTESLHSTRPGIVHRLDRDTSGVMIAARTAAAFELLKEQFADRLAKKTYLAVVAGVPKQPTAVIDLPIGRNPKKPSTFRVDTSGKSAITTYETLSSNGDMTLVRLYPKTGRTHQLRVHMAYIGCPIIGDVVYGERKKGERLMLHAASLEVTLPGGQRHTFDAPAPEAFVALFPELASHE